MIISIKGPKDSLSATIRVKDIVRLEACTLEFFGKKVFNLYIIIKADADESFHLFSYSRQENFKDAFSNLSSVLKQDSSKTGIIQVEPFTEKGSLTNSRLF